MKTIIYTLGLIALLSPLHARTWTDLNGRTLEAEYGSASQNNTITVRRTSDNKKFEIALNTLSQKDRDFVTKKTTYVHKRIKDIIFPASQPAVVATKELSIQNPTDRYTIPSYNQFKYKQAGAACGPTAILNYLMWWGNIFPEMPAKTDKLEKTQRRLVKYGRPSGKGINIYTLAQATSLYFKNEISNFDAEITIIYNPTKEWLIENSQGLNAVVMMYGRYTKSLRTRKSGHLVSVINATEDEITFNSNATQFTINLIQTRNQGLELMEDNRTKGKDKTTRAIIEGAILIKPHRTKYHVEP
jgi:hypothetical protein